MDSSTTLDILIVLNAASIIYLIWYAWYLFIANKGDLGALGLGLAAMAFLNLMSQAKDWIEDSYDERGRNSSIQQSEPGLNDTPEN
ncbi:hypothetical protein [Ruegeria sp.]|uniref:hypothetical protein n=1 Tax=Ruegeria sp. TaxID=1879320 RepID=UPI00230916FD|nr:hypothetical protein [Ruegeria sp.]MDA7965705.1 hypothetical protein [Ruegeria sp.]